MGLTNPMCIWHARGIQESINSLHSHTGVGILDSFEETELQQEAETAGTTEGAARSISQIVPSA